MEFEEMKKIWDSQNNRPMYVIDEKSMFKIVERKIKSAGSCIYTCTNSKTAKFSITN